MGPVSGAQQGLVPGRIVSPTIDVEGVDPNDLSWTSRWAVFEAEQGEALKEPATEVRCGALTPARWPAAAIHHRSMGGDVVMLSRPVWRRR